MSISEFPVQRGTAQWCQHRFDDAENTWWLAASAKYGDAAGANVHYLLLLAAGSLLKRELSASVREAMGKKTTDARAHNNWPGQIAMFLLGVYGASFVVAAAYDPVARWQFDFYQAIKNFSLRDDAAGLCEELLGLTSQVEAADLEAFADFARLPEVHLAREIPGILQSRSIA
jgi:hypothetical protein